MVNELTDTSDSFVLLCPKCSQLAQISCEAAPGCSAGFQTCCVADFQIGGACDGARLAGFETPETADFEGCGTLVAGFAPSIPFSVTLTPRRHPPVVSRSPPESRPP